MAEVSRLNELRNLVHALGAAGRGVAFALFLMLEEMDDNGFVSLARAKALCGEASTFGDVEVEDLLGLGLCELYRDGLAPRLRPCVWWLSRDPATTGTPRSFVYLVRAGMDGPFKIGRSTNVPDRVATLQTANHTSLRLVAQLPGGVEVERLLHRRFAPNRLHGEWFEPSPDLVAFVEEIGGRP